jgi:hypothetical protein
MARLQNSKHTCKVNHRSNRTAFPLPAKAGSIHAGENLMKTVNGHHVDDEVLIFHGFGGRSQEMKIRQLGFVGFYVRGLATCFYWTEKGTTWDEVPRGEDRE